MQIKGKITNYLSLVKFAHSIFAMPFALVGFTLASIHYGHNLNWTLLLLVILCMVFARNAAMSFNRWSDRHFDSLNPRTENREIPARIIRPGSALAFCIMNSILFMVSAWFINRLCFYLSPLALLVILGYSLTKRFTSLSHFVLGLGLSLAPIGAYLAVTGVFSPTPLILSLAVLFWVAGFDIIYALQDDEFDREHQLNSVPVWLGRKKSLALSLILHILTAGLLIGFGLSAGLHLIYWIGLIIFSGMLFYQHRIVKPGDLSRVGVAFFTLNGIASLVYAAFTIADLLVYA